ncbi:MAG: MipA/OmpV family protein [Oceanospirillales bacterium]|nr:MipA/OmpV family protein [Oceanospirillales bacterium]
MTYANDEFGDTYFGVNSAHDVALYPSMSGQPYRSSGGVVGWNIPFRVTTFLNKEWLISVGGRYEKLTGDAGDSPIIKQRGDDTQWPVGLGVSYIFK